MKQAVKDTIPYLLGTIAFSLLCKHALASNLDTAIKILFIACLATSLAGLVFGVSLIVDYKRGNK